MILNLIYKNKKIYFMLKFKNKINKLNRILYLLF